MSEAYWQSVRNSGMPVPTERPIADSAAELIAMLGDSRPHVRDSLVLRILSTWLASGAFDQSLAAFGDGILPGLERGLGSDDDDTVYRRSYSALLLAHVLGRDNTSYVLDETTVMRWAIARRIGYCTNAIIVDGPVVRGGPTALRTEPISSRRSAVPGIAADRSSGFFWMWSPTV